MNHFLTGFADELLKLGYAPQQEVDDDPYDGGSVIAKTMADYLGEGAKSGLKGDPKIQPAPVRPGRSPTALTTPNEMVGRLSGT